jgi:hypothetical protein
MPHQIAQPMRASQPHDRAFWRESFPALPGNGITLSDFN